MMGLLAAVVGLVIYVMYILGGKSFEDSVVGLLFFLLLVTARHRDEHA